jgi:hypothetical protein
MTNGLMEFYYYRPWFCREEKRNGKIKRNKFSPVLFPSTFYIKTPESFFLEYKIQHTGKINSYYRLRDSTLRTSAVPFQTYSNIY